MIGFKRRDFLRAALKGSGSSLAGLGAFGRSGRSPDPVMARPGLRPAPEARGSAPGFRLGLVTYELAKDWDIETIISSCEANGFEGVELRTTHRHGVEPSISKERRTEVRKRFEDSSVRLVSLGSTCEYQSSDPAEVARNIRETRKFSELAHDLGCLGVKVRPNGFPPQSDQARVLAQIGHALHQCGDVARDLGVEIWLEVHGEGTEGPPNIRRIMEAADHPAVGICWNSNDTDVVQGSVKENFELLKPWLRSCHINELWRTPEPWGRQDNHLRFRVAGRDSSEWRQLYPWRELFGLFRSHGYDRYTFAEIPASCEPQRLMRYYRALWEYHAA